jgi:nucleotide-binding universal stress UspA family protein
MATTRKLLVAIDHSEASRAALDYAVELSQELGASIVALHVWEQLGSGGESIKVRDPSGDTRPLADLARENAERDLREFLRAANPPPGLEIEQRVLAGAPAAQILEEVKRGGYDLVVLGTHGRTGVRHALIGSVAEKVVRLSTRPVLTVPRGFGRGQPSA